MLTLNKAAFVVTESDVRLALTELYGLGVGFALLAPDYKVRVVDEPAWLKALVAKHGGWDNVPDELCGTCNGVVSFNDGCPCGEYLGF